MPFTAYRSQFPFTHNKVYLNHATLSPLSTDVREKMDWFINNRSFGEIEFFQEMEELRDQTRQSLAEILNTAAANIAFTPNTATGFNFLAQGLTWEKGDEIILNDIESPSNVYPFLNLEKKGVKIIYLKSRDGIIDPQTVESAITDRTRLLSISFVEFSSGYRQDINKIGALCKKHNILFSVDASQALGIIPMDVKEAHIDFLASTGHTWLMGPMGTGFMYISPDIFDLVQPVFTGWDSVKNARDFLTYNLDLLPDARRFEYATQNYLGLCGLSASLEIIQRIGIAAIEQHILILGKQMVDRLPDHGLRFIGSTDPDLWSGIYSFASEDTEELFIFLKTNGVIGEIRNNALRFSPHFYNNRDDINKLVDLVGRFYRTHQ